MTLAVVGGATPQGAQAVPANFTDTLVASVSGPTALAFTPDGRLLVAAQYGQIRIVQGGTLLAQPALDIAAAICTSEEQGVLGVTADPGFASNGYIYVYYTKNDSGTCVNRLSRFTMSGNTASPSSELVLLDQIPSPGFHNAGDLHFGKDGYLYVSVGDGGCDYARTGGCAGANQAARDKNILLGKILRITGSGGIPPTNPFVGAGTARCNVTGRTAVGNTCQETFAWGLRNPFRIAFDPNAAGTRFYINDTGQDTWEEIDDGTAGADYGWNVREGPCANSSTTDCGPPPAGMTNPVYAYSHGESTCHAITGGAFVPNGVWPASYNGTYLYGDYTCNTIFLLTPNGTGGFTRSSFGTNVGPVVNLIFGPSAAGQSLYYTNYTNGGEIHRIDYVGAGNRPPTATVTASPRAGPLPLTVNFDGSASTDPDVGDTLTYTWNFGDGTAPATTTAPTTSHTYTTKGTFTASLVVTDNHGAASTASTVRVDPGNAPPQVRIDTPATTARFAVGQVFTLHATATDAEDGTLPASSLTWVVIKHHDTHTHPFLAPTTGNDVPITAPPPEDLLAATNSYLEIQVTATDSAGVSTTVTQNLLPHKVDLSFATSPAGLNVELNTFPYATPLTVTSWEGYAIGVNAPTQTDGSGKTWTFQSWSDGGAASHSLTTPASPAAYTATFTSTATPPGLVAAYGFREGSGTSVADVSGNGNTGAVSGPVWSTAGKYGTALSFDGVNDWITVNDSASLHLSTGVTLEAWVKPSALGSSWRTVLFKERSGGMAYSLYANQDTTRPVGQVFVAAEQDAIGSAALPVNAWSHLTSTYDGSNLRLYVNGTLVTTTPVSGAMIASTGAFRIGGNSVWGEWFTGLIDEVRVYNRALSQSEIQTDMNTPVGGGVAPPPPDTTPPTAPGSLTVTTTPAKAALTWTGSTDNVGVTRYDVYRSPLPNFTPSTANRIGQPTTTSYTDAGLAAGTYYYRVAAEDAAGNLSASSNEATANVPADRPPTVAVTAPTAGATVSGSVTVTATASDDVGVAGVQFKLDGANLGAEDTTSPYAFAWDTKTTSNGSHTLTAVARDTAANTTTSAAVTFTVNNAPQTTGLVAAYSMNAGSGTTVADGSGSGNTGTVSGPVWTSTGKYGSALSFDGVNDWVTVNDAGSLDLTAAMTLEAWVKPSALGALWRTVLFKERPGGMVYALYANQDTTRPVGQAFIGSERSAVGTASLAVNAWSHLAATYDGANLRLYVNGAVVATTAVTGSMVASTGVLRIGGNSVWSEWFTGLIDEVRVYNRALSQAEIQTDMNTPLP